MKLLIVTTSYPDDSDGAAAAGVFVRDFALALVEQGHQVSVIAPSLTSRTADEAGVRVQRFAVPKLPLSLLKPQDPRDWTAIIHTLRQGQRHVNHACATDRPDYIFALWALPSGAWARQASRRYGIPYGTWALGSDIWSLGKIPLIRQWLRHVLRHATHRYADGLQLAQDVTDISGLNCDFLPSARRLVVTNPRPVASAPTYRLAFLGRWHPNKGIDLLLEALEQLTDNDWQCIEQLRIFGGGPKQAQVYLHCARLIELGRPVEVGGFLDQTAATELLNWTDFVLIPSRIESIPVIFSDAMQAGRPVIAMPTGDLPTLLKEHGCGELAADISAAAFASALRKALQSNPSEYTNGIQSACARFDILESARRFTRNIELKSP
ncbi:MAG: glycosyltransferase [Halothiobacillaceae bacterium]